jgi:hypothetical protein
LLPQEAFFLALPESRDTLTKVAAPLALRPLHSHYGIRQKSSLSLHTNLASIFFKQPNHWPEYGTFNPKSLTVTSITSSNEMASDQRFSIFKLSICSDLNLLSVCLVLCFSFSSQRPQKVSSKKNPHC